MLLLIIFLAAFAEAQWPTGLISHWPLDGSYEDVVGTNNGVAEGSGNLFVDVAGRAGKSLRLDGSGKVNLGTSSDYDTSEFTWAVWVKVRRGKASCVCL